MGIRNSERLVESEFRTDKDGNPTGGHTALVLHITQSVMAGEPGTPKEIRPLRIVWQDGIVEGAVQTGAFVEDVLEAARQRLQFFQASKFRCRENAIALTKIEEALQWLDWRTRQRLIEGVENTYEFHQTYKPLVG